MRENPDSLTPQRTRIRRSGQRLTPDERKKAQEVFLQSFSMTANVRAACLKAGISRATIYEWAEHDTAFSILYKQAELDANDMIRAELFRRAVQGYEKPVVSVGKVVYGPDDKPMMERVYSDSLLSLLAKARMPEFREKQSLDVNANVTGSIQGSDLSNDLRLLNNEQLAQFKTWLQDAKMKQEQ
jgi:hypothetical protein